MFYAEWRKFYAADAIGDGYDPEYKPRPYQMVPLGGRRGMIIKTGTNQVRLRIEGEHGGSRLSCGLSNFHVVPFNIPSNGLPREGQVTQEVTLPANAEIHFELYGGGFPGTGYLRAYEIHETSPNVKVTKYLDEIRVTVRRETFKFFQVCHLYDTIHRDDGNPFHMRPAINEVDQIFSQQANIRIMAGSDIKLILDGSIGTNFDIVNWMLIARVIDSLKIKWGALIFQRYSAVILMVPVPVLGALNKATNTRDLPLAISIPYRHNGEVCEIILVSSKDPDAIASLGRVLAHEIGHRLGLEHLPEYESNVVDPRLPVEQKMEKTRVFWQHNLMFPVNYVRSRRLNSSQIEILGRERERARVLDIDTRKFEPLI
jgi:hypothetical protein